jgi:hypothetical protein
MVGFSLSAYWPGEPRKPRESGSSQVSCGCPSIHLGVDSEQAPHAAGFPVSSSLNDPEDSGETFWLLLLSKAAGSRTSRSRGSQSGRRASFPLRTCSSHSSPQAFSALGAVRPQPSRKGAPNGFHVQTRGQGRDAGLLRARLVGKPSASGSRAGDVREPQHWMELCSVRRLPALVVWEVEEQNARDPRGTVELDK